MNAGISFALAAVEQESEKLVALVTEIKSLLETESWPQTGPAQHEDRLFLETGPTTDASTETHTQSPSH